VNPQTWEIYGLPLLDAKEWNPIMSLSSIVIALELLVTLSSTSEEVALSRKQLASGKFGGNWTLAPREGKAYQDSKKRKYKYISKDGEFNDGSSE
jgi:hypothetical protein